jgi:hypothetical protein
MTHTYHKGKLKNEINSEEKKSFLTEVIFVGVYCLYKEY